MPGRAVEIVPCPPPLVVEAFALALGDLAPEQRREVVPHVSAEATASLRVALDGGRLQAAAWGQPQPGNTAIFWPPQFAGQCDEDIASRLCRAVAEALDARGVRMTQALISDRHAAIIPALESAGYSRLANLLYLSWEAIVNPRELRDRPPLEFEAYRDSERQRLAQLVEKTYVATQDCVALGGQRPLGEVLDGYQATGVFRPAQWLFVRAAGTDVGVLLLTDHPAARHWELMYMGVVPEARGDKFGREIVLHAQRLAFAAGAERIVLAVDAANFPAIALYHDAGFTVWDNRTVFVRFGPDAPRVSR